MNEIKKESSKTLGRGLAALFGEIDVDENTFKNVGLQLEINKIQPGEGQPRRYFDHEKMETLKESIKQQGVLQPILIRKNNDDFYEIVAGERRWRAAKEIGLTLIPVIQIQCDNRLALEIGLIENLQRDDLTPIEEAESFQRLIDEYNKTQQQIADAISKSRSYVANTLRLNNLPEKMKDLIRQGKISAGHARSLLNSPTIEKDVQKIIDEKLSVRETENLARQHRQGLEKTSKIDPDIYFLTQKIGEKLGMKTKLNFTSQGGTLVFYFQSYEQLDDLIGYLA